MKPFYFLTLFLLLDIFPLISAQTTTPIPPCVCKFETLKDTDASMYWFIVVGVPFVGTALIALFCLAVYTATSSSERAQKWRGYFGRTGSPAQVMYHYSPEEASLIPGYAYHNQMQQGFPGTPRGPKMIIAQIQR